MILTYPFTVCLRMFYRKLMIKQSFWQIATRATEHTISSKKLCILAVWNTSLKTATKARRHEGTKARRLKGSLKNQKTINRINNFFPLFIKIESYPKNQIITKYAMMQWIKALFYRYIILASSRLCVQKTLFGMDSGLKITVCLPMSFCR